jgi:hypothetical protein
MGNQIREFLRVLQKALPRQPERAAKAPESADWPVTEDERRLIEEAVKKEESRLRLIAESLVPAAMLTSGALLTAFAELIGVWGLLGFALLAAAPVVFWLQRVERRLVEAVQELKRRNSRR